MSKTTKPNITLETCKKTIWCVDCKDKTCNRHGKIEDDCPKYHCDNPITLDCEHCEFIQNLYKSTHKE